MLIASRKRRDLRIVRADSLEGILNAVENKNFVKACWCGDRECEDKIKEVAAATARIIDGNEKAEGVCAVCGKPAKHVVIYARAY